MVVGGLCKVLSCEIKLSHFIYFEQHPSCVSYMDVQPALLIMLFYNFGGGRVLKTHHINGS